MNAWKTLVELTPQATRLLILDPDGNEVLKARLPLRPSHPRALLTLLEGLALWFNQPLTAAIGVAPSVDRRFAAAFFDDTSIDSALVRFEALPPARRRRTLPGVGDFRQLRLLARRPS